MTGNDAMSSMAFVWRMTVRELKARPSRLALFAGTVAIGVAAVVSTRSILVEVEEGVSIQARSMMAADLAISSRRPFPAGLVSRVESLEAEGVLVARNVEFLSMVASASASMARLCEVKAVSKGYPFYGTLVTNPPGAIDRLHEDEIGARPAVLVSAELRGTPGFQIGQELKVGTETFVISGHLELEPDRLAAGLRLAPRIMFSTRHLPGTGLLGFGSVRLSIWLLKAPFGPDEEAKPRAWVERVAAELVETSGEEDVDIDSARDGNRNLRRILKRLRVFLSLGAVCVLLFVTIGSWAASRIHVGEHMQTIAILRCMGASGGLVILVFMAQILTLSLFGSILGVMFSVLIKLSLQRGLEGVLPFVLAGWPRVETVFFGLILGILLPTLGGLIPLIPLRSWSVKAILMRDESGPGTARAWDPWAALCGTLILGLLVALLYQQGADPELIHRLGGRFLLGALSLWIMGRLVIWLLGLLPRMGPFALRQGLANVHRPGNQTMTVLLTLGLGAYILLLVSRLESILVDEFGRNLPPDAPNLYIIDVQDGQKAAVLESLDALGAPVIEVAPLVRSQLTAIDGKRIFEIHPDAKTRPWYLVRDYVLSYRDHLTDGESLLEGDFWEAGTEDPHQISVEARTAERLGLKLGSELTVQVQGIELSARVTSIRRVTWSTLRPNFFLLMPEGLLGRAPATWFTVTRGESASARQRIQSELVAAFPNLTIIDASQAVDLFSKVLDRFRIAITIVSSILILCGLAILFGSILLTRYHRVREMAILKCLGAPMPTLVMCLGVEYFVLGCLGAGMGACLGESTALVISDHFLDIPVTFDLASVGVIALIGAVLTTAVGALASLRILRFSPMAVLKSPE